MSRLKHCMRLCTAFVLLCCVSRAIAGESSKCGVVAFVLSPSGDLFDGDDLIPPDSVPPCENPKLKKDGKPFEKAYGNDPNAKCFEHAALGCQDMFAADNDDKDLSQILHINQKYDNTPKEYRIRKDILEEFKSQHCWTVVQSPENGGNTEITGCRLTNRKAMDASNDPSPVADQGTPSSDQGVKVMCLH